jgi:tetratricopeptide (TPR) repeat protein/serine/threonine protein kinase
MNEQEIFAEALERVADRRAAFLDEACGTDAELRQRIDNLLKCHDQGGAFIDKPAGEILATAQLPATAEQPGTVIGPYKLLEQIGEGGFGVVFLAEQSEPVRRKVALKVLKPGMDTRQVVARLEAERQALAILDHPNIAKVFDGGTTPSGRPYFVMELVKGVPITDFCDQNHLTPRQRLELFLSVCQAVQHAHQKAIIHRDLKPTNVLVSRHDTAPVVKVIDFGVAKALGQELTDKTLFTGIAQMVGTPLYMSPEQAGMSDLDVDTRSDIYSLGVLLYELLTGTTPFDRNRFKKAAYDEIRRIIREEEPPKPSTRLSDSKDSLPSISAQRQTEPAKLTKLVRGELDWIVMKALEKDRNRRYETANGLAMDVQRYLTDEPVLACPPSVGYRLRKFVQRNKGKLAAAAAALMFIALVAGGIGWTVRDREARQVRLAGQVDLFLADVERLMEKQKWPEALAAAERAEAAAQGGDADDVTWRRVREVLADLRLVSRLEEARVPPMQIEEKRYDWSSADRACSAAFRDYGVDVDSLSEVEAGAKLHSRTAVAAALGVALDYWADARRTAAPQDTKWKRLVAVASLVDSDPTRNRLRGLWGREVTSQIQKELTELSDPAQLGSQPSATLDLLARTLTRVGMRKEAVSVLRSAQVAYPNDFWLNHNLAWYLAEQDTRHSDLVRFYSVASALRPANPSVLINLGRALHKQSRFEEAVACFRKAIELHPNYANGHNNLGVVLKDLGMRDEAIGCYRKAIELDPNDAMAHSNLGIALSGQKKFDEAVASFQKAIELDKEYAVPHVNLGVLLSDNGRLDDAIASYRKAIELAPKLALAHNNLGSALWRQRKWDEAIASIKKAIEVDPQYAPAYSHLGATLRKQKKLNEAITACRKAIQLDPKYSPAHQNLGSALWDKGLRDEAIASFRTAIEVDPKNAGAYSSYGTCLMEEKEQIDAAFTYLRKAIELDPQFARAHFNLGVGLKKIGKIDDAIACYRKAIELDPSYAEAFNNLGAALRDQKKLKEAVAALRMAVQLDPEDARRHINLGIVLEDQGKLDEAIASFRKAMELEPKLARAHNRLGRTLQQQGKLDEAIACFRKAIELEPKDPAQHLYLGTALHDKRQLDEAIAAYRRVIELDPKHANAHNYLGNALKLQEKFREAIPFYRRAAELNPKVVVYQRNLASMLIKGGDHREGIKEFRRVVEMDPKDAWSLNSLAWQLSTASDRKLWSPKEAVEFARRSVKLDPAPWHNWNTLSVACYRAGDWQEALKAREGAIRRNDKGSAMCWNGLGMAMIRWQLGQKEEARTAYDRVAEEAKKYSWLQSFRQEAAEMLDIMPATPNVAKDKK